MAAPPLVHLLRVRPTRSFSFRFVQSLLFGIFNFVQLYLYIILGAGSLSIFRRPAQIITNESPVSILSFFCIVQLTTLISASATTRTYLGQSLLTFFHPTATVVYTLSIPEARFRT
jgi:hypothetical protein